MNSLEFKPINTNENKEIKKDAYMDLVNDFGYFITLNASKIEQDVKPGLESQVDEIRRVLRGPLINGKNYAQFISDYHSDLAKPDVAKALLKQVHGLLTYLAPRMEIFVDESGWKKRYSIVAEKYKNVVLGVDLESIENSYEKEDNKGTEKKEDSVNVDDDTLTAIEESLLDKETPESRNEENITNGNPDEIESQESSLDIKLDSGEEILAIDNEIEKINNQEMNASSEPADIFKQIIMHEIKNAHFMQTLNFLEDSFYTRFQKTGDLIFSQKYQNSFRSFYEALEKSESIIDTNRALESFQSDLQEMIKNNEYGAMSLNGREDERKDLFSMENDFRNLRFFIEDKIQYALFEVAGKPKEIEVNSDFQKISFAIKDLNKTIQKIEEILYDKARRL